jgi:hypothetical protein
MQEYAAIKDLTTYTDRMGKGLIDKLFFVDKIDPAAVVDYGSADGSVAEATQAMVSGRQLRWIRHRW